ncbi:MAG: Ig-like domain-containing protein, partial [Nitrospirota bacterium]
MKRIFIILTLLSLPLSFLGCGGGSGSLDSPDGENPGKSTLIELSPSHFVAHTNSDITLHAKVLDGNGSPVRDKTVRFTNLSPVGVLNKTTARTDESGIATVTLHSHDVGFVTIQAELNQGVALVRDRKTVFFTASNISQFTPTLTLEVDGNDPDQIFNESEDFNLLETAGDNAVVIRATHENAAGPISGSQITFAADRPYRIGTDPEAECSDGSEDCDVRFPAGVVAVTDSSGEATIPVEIEPSALTSTATTLNILAQADIGTFNIITLFLGPVFIQTVDVGANPTT